jgi:hypothetical protein
LSEKKVHYGIRLRIDQAQYLRRVPNASKWVREAIDEKRKREKTKNKD